MKLTVVGGGSTYTPELIDGFARLRDMLPIDELWLVDPDPERLALVGGVAQRMFRAAGPPRRDRARPPTWSPGSRTRDAVLLQLRVGGQAARHGDETWPHECGCIGQETTGPGGFAKALRTVPVVLDIAEAVRRHAAPDAWIIDFTNPVGHRHPRAARGRPPGGRAVQRGDRLPAQVRRACSASRRRGLARPRRPEPPHLGALRHGAPATARRGRAAAACSSTRLPELAEEVELPGAAAAACRARCPPTTCATSTRTTRCSREQLGAPTRARGGAATWSGGCWRCTPTRPSTRSPSSSRSAAARSTPRRPSTWWPRSPADRGDVQVVNVRNDGTLPFLPDDHVIEVPATVTADGLTPLPVAPLAPEMQRADRPRRRVRAARARRRGGRRARPGAAGAARASARRPVRPKAERLTDLLLAREPRAPRVGEVSDLRAPLAIAVDGGRLEDGRRRARSSTARCSRTRAAPARTRR